MKVFTRRVYRKTPSGPYRQYSELQCDQCGACTYAYGPKGFETRIRAACMVCIQLSVAKRRGITDAVFKRVKHKEISKRFKTGDTTRTACHGLSHLKLYKRWLNMFNRCYDPTAANYEHYGGRGIRVCDEWTDYSIFYWHMGEVPDDMELDRVDNDGDYCPENCRWVTPAINTCNRRSYHKRGKDRQNANWWVLLGLSKNPYIYGPMPWKKTNLKYRRAEAIERGWHVPRSQRK